MRLSDLPIIAVVHDAEFEDLGLLGGPHLGWFSDERLYGKIAGPVITSQSLLRLTPRRSHVDGRLDYLVGVGLAPDPETAFWNIHEWLIDRGFYGEYEPVHASKYVTVGEGCDIDRTVKYKQGFEIHKARHIRHAGGVVIGDRVSIGAYTCVDRAVFKVPTSIGDDTHIDNLVHVAHNVRIGRRCMIVAGTVIGGSAVIGDDVFIGIGARIRPGVRIGDGAFIGMSVTVLKDVAAGERLVIAHD